MFEKFLIRGSIVFCADNSREISEVLSIIFNLSSVAFNINVPNLYNFFDKYLAKIIIIRNNGKLNKKIPKPKVFIIKKIPPRAKNNSPIKDINQFDTFRIDIRSRVLNNYLEKV